MISVLKSVMGIFVGSRSSDARLFWFLLVIFTMSYVFFVMWIFFTDILGRVWWIRLPDPTNYIWFLSYRWELLGFRSLCLPLSHIPFSLEFAVDAFFEDVFFVRGVDRARVVRPFWRQVHFCCCSTLLCSTSVSRCKPQSQMITISTRY